MADCQDEERCQQHHLLLIAIAECLSEHDAEEGCRHQIGVTRQHAGKAGIAPPRQPGQPAGDEHADAARDRHPMHERPLRGRHHVGVHRRVEEGEIDRHCDGSAEQHDQGFAQHRQPDGAQREPEQRREHRQIAERLDRQRPHRRHPMRAVADDRQSVDHHDLTEKIEQKQVDAVFGDICPAEDQREHAQQKDQQAIERIDPGKAGGGIVSPRQMRRLARAIDQTQREAAQTEEDVHRRIVEGKPIDCMQLTAADMQQGHIEGSHSAQTGQCPDFPVQRHPKSGRPAPHCPGDAACGLVK